MKIAIYRGLDGKKIEIEYDETAPCLICGEPVMGASMGGTLICPWCDMGKCRYCGITIFILKESLDEGRSKKELLDHMKWHKEHEVKHA